MDYAAGVAAAGRGRRSEVYRPAGAELGEGGAARVYAYWTRGKVDRKSPAWQVLWGTHSRLFWGFPCFDAPPGTVISAPATAQLTALMQAAELAASSAPHHGHTNPANIPF